MAGRKDLYIHRGETFTYRFDSLGKDLSGYTARIQFKPNVDHIDDTLLHNVSNVVADSDGVITMRIESSETAFFNFGAAVYDVALSSVSGDVSYPYWGIVVVNEFVTD